MNAANCVPPWSSVYVYRCNSMNAANCVPPWSSVYVYRCNSMNAANSGLTGAVYMCTGAIV